ncbi:hypothetical protein AADG42_02260 [Ammonicoccus fulvus]|uniref:Uncharacterized protein n=1 Tax=Ammonicoccus fulvus TaxID=3138240 RepID=A0ABZ3FJJ0_9ACTN
MPTTDALDLAELTVETDQPWVTFVMPTHRAGAETTSQPLVLKNLLRDAVNELPDEAREQLTEQIEPLLGDFNFWQNQADGLALFASGDHLAIRHLSIAPEAGAHVSEVPYLLPLVPIMGQPRHFTILQVSLKQVRLFEVTGEQIEEVGLGSIPASVEDLSSDRDHQTHLQHSPQGGGSVNYHGHGADAAVDEVRRDRFLRHVARGLEEREASHGTHGTLFIAATQDTAEQFARLSGRNELSDRIVSGSADGLTAPALLERAMPQLAAYAEARRTEKADHLGQRRAQGRVADDPGDVVNAATTGRVETLYVGTVPEAVAEPVNRAILETLRCSGDVHPAPSDDHEGVAATLRF